MLLGLHLPNQGNCGYDFSYRHVQDRILELLKKIERHKSFFDFQYAVFHPPQEQMAERSYPLFIKNLKQMPFPIILENVRELTISQFESFYKELKGDLQDQLQGICVDIPHAFLEGQNWEDYFHLFGHEVKVIHLSDCKGSVDSHLPFGMGGDLCLEDILRRLQNLDFKGFMNFEILPPSLATIHQLFKNYLTVRKTLKIEEKQLSNSFQWIYLISRLMGVFNN